MKHKLTVVDFDKIICDENFSDTDDLEANADDLAEVCDDDGAVEISTECFKELPVQNKREMLNFLFPKDLINQIEKAYHNRLAELERLHLPYWNKQSEKYDVFRIFFSS